MIKCVAVYPHEISSEYKTKVVNTIKLASKYGFNEVFTTIHLPEYSLENQLKTFAFISKNAKKYNLEVTVDIGGHFINEVLSNDKILDELKKIPFDFIRLDYGYDIVQTATLYSKLKLKGFVINASIYNEKEVDDIISSLMKIDKKIEIRACHNYYVRQETGLDSDFVIKQDLCFKKYNIPIYYCVPTHSNPRGPLHEGLCTIEWHRNKPIAEIITDLYLNHDLNALMMADEWLSEEEFKEVETTLNELSKPLPKSVKIKVTFMETATKQEKDVVLQEHTFRFDSPNRFLRSQSSRQMSEFADSFKKNVVTNRKAGYITIDNELYKRYSGELQVVMSDSSVDERVNFVARVINKKDLIKLARFREGITYTFVEDDE